MIRFAVRKEKLKMSIAWFMPKWLVYWCSIRLIANATQGEWGNQNATELKAMEALKRWESKFGV